MVKKYIFKIVKKDDEKVSETTEATEIVPEVPEDLGNTSCQIPPVASKKQISPAKRWVFTLNNYTEDEISSISSIVLDSCSKWIISKEVGEKCGTPHLQGFIQFKVKKRPIGVFGNPRIRWKKSKSEATDMHQVIYIEKDGDVIAKHGMPTQPKPIKLITPDRPYQKFILDILKTDPDERTIYWFFDYKGGIGKTSLSKYLVVNRGACIMSGKSADVRNGIVEYKKSMGDTPEIIVYNVPRSLDKKYLSYEGLENCKDMCFYSGKYEGAMIVGNAPHLIVFANEPPDVHKLSADRWKIYEVDEEYKHNEWNIDFIDDADELDL